MYDNLLKSGMFWEFCPKLSGNFEQDKQGFIVWVIDDLKYMILTSNPETLLGYKEAKDFIAELELLQKPKIEESSLDWDFSFMGGIKED